MTPLLQRFAPALRVTRLRALARLRVGLVLAVAASPLVALAQPARLPDLPVVSTLAGTGVPGIVDGPGKRAQFEGPQGIAYDAHGNLYVADTPAQRIRRVDPHGVVSTVAGSGAASLFGAGVPGGYRDGAANVAQFDNPTDVAVAPDGSIYVADSLNRCIRVIRAGRVTTFAGSPARDGGVDGARAVASFAAPRSLAFDTRGDLYVADPPNGVREIAPDGRVTTLRDPSLKGVWAVGMDRRGRLIAASALAIVVYDVRARRIVARMPTVVNARSSPYEARVFVGPAAALASLGGRDLVYADDLFSTVRLVQFGGPDMPPVTRALGAPALLNAGARGGGFRDGPGREALYDQPMGVAVAPSGAIAVADTGNRRIRLLEPFDRRSVASDGASLPTTPDRRAYRVALVADAGLWSDPGWHASIPGMLQDRLCATHAQCKVRVYAVRLRDASPRTLETYAFRHLSDGTMNTVVAFLPSSDARPARALGAVLGHVRARLARTHTGLLVVALPGALDMPNEAAYLKLDPAIGPSDPSRVAAVYAAQRAAIETSRAASLDLWPAFFRNDRGRDFHSLFRTWDRHLNAFGDALVAESLARRLSASVDAALHDAPR